MISEFLSDQTTLSLVLYGFIAVLLLYLIIKFIAPAFKNKNIDESSDERKGSVKKKKGAYVFDINDTLGLTGEVFKTIPSSKIESGGIKVVFQNVTYEVEARSALEKKIWAGTTVKIVEVKEEIVLVEKI